MTTFQVADMTCRHCVSAITKAVMDADADASVSIDLPTRRVEVRSIRADTTTLGAAIAAAGYTAVALARPTAQPTTTQAKRSGCCCG